MSNLRQAAEMALKYFEDAHGLEDTEVAIKEALRQALDDKPPVKSYAGGKPNYCTPEETPEVTGEVTGEVPCKTHPDAPHGFDRNASHSADRYVCECEGWEPVDAVNMSQDRVDEMAKGEHEPLYMDMSQVPTGMPDWKPGMVFPAPKKEWVGLTDAEKEQATGWSVEHIEAKLKEKNGG